MCNNRQKRETMAFSDFVISSKKRLSVQSTKANEILVIKEYFDSEIINISEETLCIFNINIKQMSLTEQNHVTDTHQQLDDELQHILLHKVNHSLHGQVGKSCLLFSAIKRPSFCFYSKQKVAVLFFFSL